MAEDRVRTVRRLERLHVGIVQVNIQRGNGLFQVRHLAGADNGRRHAGLLKQPRQRDLRVRHSAV